MANPKPTNLTRSIAVDPDIYAQIEQLAEEAGTTKGSVASAILRLGMPYFNNRWREFLAMYPELGPNGRPVPMTENRPTVPRR